MTKNIAVLEGTDGVGKTSTIKELKKLGIYCEDRNKDVISKNMLFSIDMKTRAETYYEYLKTTNQKIIFLINNDKVELEKRINFRNTISDFDKEAYAYNQLYLETFNYMKERKMLQDKMYLIDCTHLTLKEQVQKVVAILGDNNA